ncbi:hypothetical protein COB64_00375 [Candidatus Wolfebacteria bacterium]|nr:MAG: hypothetical protein COB64_00375 [Candidatus Wolfebacteria bacterium]
MQTKFILHGGYASKLNAENDSFFREILSDAPENPQILLVNFAKDEREYEQTSQKDKTQFNRNNIDNRNLSFNTANQDSFEKQIVEADIVYLHGG